ncbi:MAG: hypothetical protein PHF60_04390 [Candidatus ainarchaeum sp.]|nr:hypothetical protein [Candidatus ainarchaeum sp.]
MKKILTVILLIGIILIGCTQQVTPPPGNVTPPDGNHTIPSAVHKGVTLTPKSFQGSDFTDFFQKASQAGEIVSWAGDWNELGNTNNGGPKVITELASTYDYTPVVEAQFFTQSTGQLLRPLDEANKQSYKSSAVAFAEKYKPEYMAFGIEVNILYEKSPEDFEDFVSFYSEVYDAVKTASPNTKVFTIFQLERMKGLHGGLFGGTNDPANAQWSLLDRFPKSDIIAFTTYPDLIYKDPSEIPEGYYTEISSHTSKPIAFTEVGWHSDASPAGWESSEAEQAQFINRFFNLTEGLDEDMVIWSFMYDQDTAEPFKSMGLYKSDGAAKQAWDVWVETG